MSKLEAIRTEVKQLEVDIHEIESQIYDIKYRLKMAKKIPGVETMIKLSDMYDELYVKKTRLNSIRHFVEDDVYEVTQPKKSLKDKLKGVYRYVRDI